jgi:endonuclease G
VFGAADPIVKDVQVPLEFWKLVVMVKRAGTPSATAYLHTQRNLLGLRDFEFGAFRSYQVKVSAIIDATQLAFHSLSAFDPLARQRDSGAGVELKRLTDILL